MTITLLPLGVFALMGLGGDSLLQYVSHMVMFLVRRRQLHYRRIGYHYDTNTHKGSPPKKRTGKPPAKRKAGVRSGLHSDQRAQKRHRRNH